LIIPIINLFWIPVLFLLRRCRLLIWGPSPIRAYFYLVFYSLYASWFMTFTTAVSAFICNIRYDNMDSVPSTYLDVEPSVGCNSEEYYPYKFMAAASLVYSVIIIIVLGAIVRSEMKKRNLSFSPIGFLFKCYKDNKINRHPVIFTTDNSDTEDIIPAQVYTRPRPFSKLAPYWEIVLTVLRIFLCVGIGINSAYSYRWELMLATLVLIVVAVVLHMYVEPFNDPKETYMEKVSLLTILFTYILNTTSPPNLILLLAIIVLWNIAVSLGFLGLWAYDVCVNFYTIFVTNRGYKKLDRLI